MMKQKIEFRKTVMNKKGRRHKNKIWKQYKRALRRLREKNK